MKRSVGLDLFIIKTETMHCLSQRSLRILYPCLGWVIKENVLALERVQRNATMYILDYLETDYKERLKQLHLIHFSWKRND